MILPAKLQPQASRGVVMIAFGAKAQAEARLSRKSLREHSALPVLLLEQHRAELSDKAASRSLKTELLDCTPFTDTLYLDADTRTNGDISAGFAMLDAGFDMAISFSDHQGKDAFWHVSPIERETTYRQLGYTPLQWQCGVMFVRRNARTEAFFAAWHEEWARYRGEDQAAFVRALQRVPLKIWVLGKPYNGGQLIQHRYGACRQ